MTGVGGYAAIVGPTNEELITRHGALVKRIAHHLMNRLPPSVQIEDLIQAGMVGLIEAGRHFDPSQGASFETYAGIRIRGAMLDEIRRSDWTPRSVHRKARQVAEAMHAIEAETGRAARDADVAARLQISLDEYYQIVQDASGARVFSYEELAESGDGATLEAPGQRHDTLLDSPLDGLQKARFREALIEAIGGLTEREQTVIALYYDEELNLREVGQVLGVSESRVCQILGKATLRLRGRLGDWLGRESD